MSHPELDHFNRMVAEVRAGGNGKTHQEAAEDKQSQADADRDQVFEMLVEMVTDGAADELSARILTGEAASKLRSLYGHGAIKKAAQRANREYTTVWEYCKVIEFYQQLSGDEMTVYESDVRDLVAENPLSWTHLRVAMGYSPDDVQKAKRQLLVAAARGMTPEQFKRHIKKMQQAEGSSPTCQIVLKGERPQSWNKLHSGGNIGAYGSEKEAVEWVVKAAVMEQCPDWHPKNYPVTIRYDCYMDDPFDWDNVFAKGYTDGLVKAKVIPDDRPKFVLGGSVWVYPASGDPRVVITIEPVSKKDRKVP